MQIINGKNIADAILTRCKQKLAGLSFQPVLAIVMVGNNPASETYISKKQAAGEFVGIKVEIYRHEHATETDLISLIEKLNIRKDVSGIIVQLPVPEVNQQKLCQAITPEKDVDGLNPLNLGNLWLNTELQIIPATVKAIYCVLEFIAGKENITYEQFIDGKNVLIINSSNIIGKPMAGVLLNDYATVTLAHSHTKNISKLILDADIVISGTGKNNFISEQKFKTGAVLIDVGFNKTGDIVHGDVGKKFEGCEISWLTPVPGGIGPIGVACLIENVVDVAITA